MDINARVSRFNPAKWVIVAAVVLFLGSSLKFFTIIDAGHRGVKMNFGAVQSQPLGEGFHLLVPFYQTVRQLNVQVQKEQAKTTAASKDLQDTHGVVALNFHLDPKYVPWIYQNLGVDYTNRIIDPDIQESVKSITAQYNAVELITQREKVRGQIEDMLREKLKPDHILVDNFSIVDFRFSSQFEAAIEAKQTAEQLALKATQDLRRVKIEAEQKVTRAKAEADALNLQKQAVTPELVQLRAIEAQIQAIDKWDGHLPNVTGGGIPFINVATARH